MDTAAKRYVASVNITIEATSDDEAEAMLEGALAGVGEYVIVDIFAEDVDERTA